MSDAREPEKPSPSEAKTSPASAGRSGLFDRLKFLKRHIVAVATVGAVLSGLVGYWTTYRTVHEVIAPAVVVKALPGGPSPPAMSVVVAPLAAPEGDTDAARFANALTRDLVSMLGRVEGNAGRLRVVAFQGDSAGAVIDPGELGHRLNARYVLAGSLSRSGEGYTVNLQLVDAATGGQVWSDGASIHNSDASGKSSIGLRSLARQLRTALVGAETRRVLAQPISVLSAPELVLRARALWDSDPSLAGVLEARKLVDKALQLDSDLVSALLERADLNDAEYGLDPKADRDRLVREIDKDAARATILDPTNAYAWSWRADALRGLERWDGALEANATAIKLDPDEAAYLISRANIMNYMGRPAEALEITDRVLAMDIAPANNLIEVSVACNSYLLLGQTEQAAAMCEKAVVFYSGWQIPALLVAAYADQGEMVKAAAAKADLLRTQPGFMVDRARAYDRSSHPEYTKLAEKYYYEGLRKAGIPEQ